ncbi:MAG: endonuclease VII domain-containing protein [Patescibacteria group bacterium]
MKACTTCGIEKDSELFYAHSGFSSGRNSRCKICVDKVNKRNRDKNNRTVCSKCGLNKKPEEFASHHSWCKTCKNEASKLWAKNNRSKVRDTVVKRLYGITLEQVNEILLAQNNRCAICKTDKPGGFRNTWQVDHDHETDIVRGVLCSSCNNGLGCFKDDVTHLYDAIKYLEKQEK